MKAQTMLHTVDAVQLLCPRPFLEFILDFAHDTKDIKITIFKELIFKSK